MFRPRYTVSVSRLILVVLCALASTSPAHANCARPLGYDVRVTGNTVEIDAVNFGSRRCPDQHGMLRQNVETGDVVRIADFCNAEGHYVDECVPPGRYRYGFAAPYECAPSACSTDYYSEVAVTSALPACARSPGDLGPGPAAHAPWGDSAAICGYGSRKGLLSIFVLGAAALTFVVGVLIVLLRRRRAG
jgi:hypothetical protein